MPLVLESPKQRDENRAQFRRMLGELAELSRSDVAPPEFHRRLLARVMEAVHAEGGAIWTFGPQGQELAYQINFRVSGLIEGDKLRELTEHNLLIQGVADVGQELSAAPRTSTSNPELPGNPTGHWIFACRMRISRETWGVVEVLQRPGPGTPDRRSCLQFLAHTCQIGEEYFRKKELRQFFDRETLWSKLENFARRAHASLDLTTTARILAQEGRELIECDRLCIAAWYGRECRVEAISGVDSIERRAPTIKLLDRLASAVAVSREPVWYDGNSSELAPQIERVLVDYVDETDVKELALIPLTHQEDEASDDDGDLVGVLVIEQFEGSCRQAGMTQRIDAVAKHAAVAVAHALECRGWPLVAAQFVRRSPWYRQWITLPRVVTAAVAVAMLAVALMFPAPFDISASGTLQPTLRNVYAATKGTVVEILVKHGDAVRAGQPLLKLENDELQATVDAARSRYSVVQGNLATHRSQRAQAERRGTDFNELVMRIGELELEAQSLENQLAILRRQQDDLVVKSAADGEVITWDVEGRLLNRPVNEGDLLLEVAEPNGPWRLDLSIPESRLGKVLAARSRDKRPLGVDYVLADEPGVTRRGLAQQIEKAADASTGENAVRMLVDVSSDDMPARPRLGISATARVHCGWRPLFYVWFHEALDFLRKAWFRVRP
jgi:hypothetical protein